MSETHTCPNCHSVIPADAPAGVCPACALRAGFDPSEAATISESEPQAPAFPIEDLARLLPELEILELLGRGGMGAVYRARHRRLGRAVAVKVLDPAVRGKSGFDERFAREARTMAQLDHPNVVRVYDFGHRDGLYYLIMELVDGVSLRQMLEAGSLEPHEALAMVPRICEALQYAHDRGVVHRDVKPENILVDRSGAIKIADFGLAKIAEDKAGPRLTQTRHVMGTPHYMAPEQIEHPGQVDHRADIFALGVVFYELLTGELPVGRFAPPSKKVKIDVRLDEVVLRTLEKEPNLRYQQASELQSDLESVSSNSSPGVEGVVPSVGSTDSDSFEYRSTRTLFGMPLVHVVRGRDPETQRLRVAHGVIAIGEVAVGVVAVGIFSFGGVAIGAAAGLGLLTFAGVAVGLLTAVGGIALGPFAFGAIALGVVTVGAVPLSLLTPTPVAKLTGWVTMAVGCTIGAVIAAYAWAKDRISPEPG